MSTLALVSTKIDSDMLSDTHRFQLQQLRADALDKLMCGLSAKDVADELVIQFENILNIGSMVVFRASPNASMLAPFCFPSVPDSFVKVLLNTRILDENTHCGSAFFTQQVQHIENIYNLPIHAPLKRVAEHCKIFSCFSFPIFTHSTSSMGALDLYPSEANKAQVTKSSPVIAAFASLLAQIFERAQQVEQKERAHTMLTEKLAEQNLEFSETHKMLKKALEQRDQVRNDLVKMEKSSNIGTMLSSMTHEMNTPIGISLTAITHLQRVRKESVEAFEANQLKKSDLAKFYKDCEEACTLAERNLARAASIIGIFKQLSFDQYNEEKRAITLTKYLCEILLSIKPTLKKKRAVICMDIDTNLAFESFPAALGQILINCITNSIDHGFEDTDHGRIVIKARLQQIDSRLMLVLTHSDNGKGMDQETRQNIYRPFFTRARHKGGTGLGMHICYNLAVNVLGGSIECDSQIDVGTSFTIKFPVNNITGFVASA